VAVWLQVKVRVRGLDLWVYYYYYTTIVIFINNVVVYRAYEFHISTVDKINKLQAVENLPPFICIFLGFCTLVFTTDIPVIVVVVAVVV